MVVAWTWKPLPSIGVGDGRTRGHVPPKIGKKYFSANYYVNLGIFLAKIM